MHSLQTYLLLIQKLCGNTFAEEVAKWKGHMLHVRNETLKVVVRSPSRRYIKIKGPGIKVKINVFITSGNHYQWCTGGQHCKLRG